MNVIKRVVANYRVMFFYMRNLQYISIISRRSILTAVSPVFSFRVPTLLVLNDCNIDSAGEEEQIKQKCKLVKELDLAQNKLENWNEIFTILAHMPSVEFVNLSMNKLTVAAPIDPPVPVQMNSLRSLVLNNTKLDWYSVEQLLSLLPVLEELHLSLNEYTHVLIDTQDVDDEVNVDERGVENEEEEQEGDNSIECMCQPSGSYKRSESLSFLF